MVTSEANIKSMLTDHRKYRLLLVVRWPVGGIRSYIRYVYNRFDPELFEITILGPEHPELILLSEDLNGMDIKFIKLSEKPSNLEFFKTILAVIVRGGCDLIHSQGFTAGICAALPALLFNRPHIVTPHEMLNGEQFSGVFGWIKKNCMGIALSRVSTIQCVSNDARDNLLKYIPLLNRKKDKSVVIMNGIEVNRFIDVEPRELRKELGAGDEVFLIGFLGRFMPVKGFKYLVDAIEELSNNKKLSKIPLVLTFGEGAFKREEKADILKRGLDKYFRFLPFTTDVAETIKALDVVVMPSLSEACPLLAMEVLVTGTPLIATNCIGLREVVFNTPAYIVPPGNGKKIAEGIESFMTNGVKKDTFKAFSREAASKFDVECQISKIKEMILSNLSNISSSK